MLSKQRHAMRRVSAVAGLTVAVALGAAPSAPAAIKVESVAFDTVANARTADPSVAGGHPDLRMSIAFEETAPGSQLTVESPNKMILELPRGVVVDPQAVGACPKPTFWQASNSCPAGSIVGTGTGYAFGPPRPIRVFNLDTANSDRVARIGVQLLPSSSGYIELSSTVSPQNGHVPLTAGRITQTASVYAMDVTLWGVPVDNNGSGLEAKPYVYSPTYCGEAPEGTFTFNSLEDQASFVSASDAIAQPTDCESLEFEPAVAVEPDSHVPGGPTGLSVELTVPQSDDPDGRATSTMRRASVTLPEGMSINPGAANGLAACSDAQFSKGDDDPVACPTASKVGTVEVESPMLAEPLPGDLYVGEPQPGKTYRLFMHLAGQGVTVKLEGDVHADPQTGRLTTTFDETPQLPFSRMSMHLKGGSRALLANPTSCGEHEYKASLSPWSGNPATKVWDTISIDCPGAAGFAPAFSAGSMSTTGGGFSPFGVRISRGDGDQFLAGVSMDLPPGLLAKVQGVAQCQSADADAGSCPAASRVGSVMVGAGAGDAPFYLSGDVFLTEGYKGAPFGLAVRVRAIAGPYDLGTVVVRQALHVDPDDASVRVVSDPFPTILEGVPLRLRSIDVDIDRREFMVNPTSCAAKQIAGTLTSTQGASSAVGQRFQVGGCQALGFKPKLALRLTGKGQRKPGGHPGLRAFLSQPGGQAGMEQVRVKLPASLALDPENANGLCSYEQGLDADCPSSSEIGTAKAVSPLLNKPLAGPVYFVEGVRFDKQTGNRIRTLPTLLVKLAGEIEVNLRATTSVSGKKLVTTFAAVPDAPVTQFGLKLDGGDNGILAVTGERSLCARRQTAIVETDAQNGRRHDFLARMKAPCRK